MKRDLLAKSLAQMGTREAPPAPPPTAPGSLKSMSDVLTDVSSHAVQEIDVADIAESPLADRFDVSQGLDDLIASIKASGQQLPALVRYRRSAGPRYEVVYGRRRIAACRVLGIKVKAHVKEMDPREALLSQALENSARLERSFIEQAVFASALEDQGFKRAEIGEVLAVDKGTLSKLIGAARDIPSDVIFAIGAAHDAGRRPWLELRRLVKSESAPTGKALLRLVPQNGTPAEKLNATLAAVQAAISKKDAQPPRASAPFSQVPKSAVTYRAKGKRLVVQIANAQEQGFITFLEGNLEELYEEWKQRGEKKGKIS